MSPVNNQHVQDALTKAGIDHIPHQLPDGVGESFAIQNPTSGQSLVEEHVPNATLFEKKSIDQQIRENAVMGPQPTQIVHLESSLQQPLEASTTHPAISNEVNTTAPLAANLERKPLAIIEPAAPITASGSESTAEAAPAPTFEVETNPQPLQAAPFTPENQQQEEPTDNAPEAASTMPKSSATSPVSSSSKVPNMSHLDLTIGAVENAEKAEDLVQLRNSLRSSRNA